MTAATVNTPDHDRRRECRTPVDLPMLVRGTDRLGGWFEQSAAAENLSSRGVSFAIQTTLEMGAQIYVSIPEPISTTDQDSEFSTKARVVHLKPGKSPRETIVGAEFLGKRFQRIAISVWV